MEHYKFNQNRECEFFPCHKCADAEEFSCLFCYCPLYALGDRCGGNFVYLETGSWRRWVRSWNWRKGKDNNK